MRTSEHSSSRYLPAISGPSGMVTLKDLLDKDIFGGFVLGIITYCFKRKHLKWRNKKKICMELCFVFKKMFLVVNSYSLLFAIIIQVQK